MWLDRTQIATLSLLISLSGLLTAQEAKPAAPAPAPPSTEAPKPAAAPKAKVKAKAKAKPAPADNAAVKPEVAARSKVRSKQLQAQKKSMPVPMGPPVDVNSASKEELMKLPGITEAYADKIIAKRPYPTKTYLILRGAIPHAVYLSLKGRIAAIPKP
ncbi:MAG TPA: helix-hairpin-helix domain-containing protein [Holophagaceae bacterium]|nr:helix-hairpin-helix domain-containing protein [Holophagaceae bacterium]